MLKIPPDNTSKIIESIKTGKVVAIPTETVFGLAISLNSPTALEKLIYLKKRDINSGKVFTLVPTAKIEVPTYCQLNKETNALIQKHIPGELTLILPKNPSFKHPYFDHFQTIGIRIPKFNLFQEILPSTGPLLLTSANPRGGIPANTPEKVEKLLPKIDVVVEGKSGDHLPSTILDCTKKPFTVIRQGSLKV